MPTTKPKILLPLDFNQLFDLALQLPEKERRQLADMLLQEDSNAGIPEAHKELVRARVKKYDDHPELLIDEDRAMEMINNM